MSTGDDRGEFRQKRTIIIRNPLLYPAELRAQSSGRKDDCHWLGATASDLECHERSNGKADEQPTEKMGRIWLDLVGFGWIWLDRPGFRFECTREQKREARDGIFKELAAGRSAFAMAGPPGSCRVWLEEARFRMQTG